jgi:hypothetical protein
MKYSKLDVVVKRTNTGRCWGGSTAIAKHITKGGGHYWPIKIPLADKASCSAPVLNSLSIANCPRLVSHSLGGIEDKSGVLSYWAEIAIIRSEDSLAILITVLCRFG